MSDLLRRDQKVIWHPFTQLKDGLPDLAISRGKGAYLFTDDGRQIIDAISSWWVNLHGHAHPKINEAIQKQVNTLEHVLFAGFTHEPAVELAERLIEHLPGPYSKVFYSDNGSTATEVGLKMAIQYWHNQGIRDKKKVVAFEGGYHGDTFGAMAVGERGDFTTPFWPYLFEVEFIPYPTEANLTHVQSQLRRLVEFGNVCAFIFEPLVQGSAGMRMTTATAMDSLLDIAHQAEVITIADEVFTGFGRLETLFATEQLQQKPDIICLSKGITGGYLPLGATVCKEKIIDVFRTSDILKTFFHGHSYTANPVSCAAAVASFDLLLEPETEEKRRMIEQKHLSFQHQLNEEAMVNSVNVKGTLLALEWETSEQTSYTNEIRHRLYPYFLNKGILLRPLGNVIYILPPFCIEEKDLEKIYSAIFEALRTI